MSGSTHKRDEVPWLEGDALKVFFALGGRAQVGDEVVIDPSMRASIFRRLRMAAEKGTVCRVVEPPRPNSNLVVILTPRGKTPIRVLSRMLSKLRRTSCLTKTK